MNENALLSRKVSIRRTHTQGRVHGAIAKRGNAQPDRGRENLLLDPSHHTPLPPPKKKQNKTKPNQNQNQNQNPKTKTIKKQKNNVNVKGHIHPEIKIVHI